MVFNFSSSTISSFSSSESSTSSFYAPTQLEITEEDQRNYKEVLFRMQEQKLRAHAMFMSTNETIYRVAMEAAKEAIKVLKNVICKGVCYYEPGSKTDNLMIAYKRVYQEYAAMVLKMEIKMVPTKAEFVIECWLKKDAALKAAKECKLRRREKKEREAAKATAKSAAAAETAFRAKGQFKKLSVPEEAANRNPQFMRPIVLPPLSPITSKVSLPAIEPEYANIDTIFETKCQLKEEITLPKLTSSPTNLLKIKPMLKKSMGVSALSPMISKVSLPKIEFQNNKARRRFPVMGARAREINCTREFHI